MVEVTFLTIGKIRGYSLINSIEIIGNLKRIRVFIIENVPQTVYTINSFTQGAMF